ncbi:MAG TPA: hypothetical protein HA362_02260 [Nanoarchaeota archaeon]|nr:hypothetical protein [Nanoarchaeota archaeon]
MRIGKKASYDFSRKAIYFIVVLFVLTFIFLYMHGAIVNYNKIAVQKEAAIAGVVLAQEAIMSPKCFAYVDAATGRAYPGMIDLEKFNSEGKQRCMEYLNIPYKITLLSFGNVPELQSDGKTIAKGSQEELKEKVVRSVLIMNKGQVTRGSMTFELNDYFIDDSKKENSEPYEEISRQSEEFYENVGATVSI